jgi:hypothetical protein
MEVVSISSMTCTCISFRTQSCNQHPWCKHISACKYAYSDEVFNRLCSELQATVIEHGPDGWVEVVDNAGATFKAMPQFAWCSCMYMERCMSSFFKRVLCPHICAAKLLGSPEGTKGTDILVLEAAVYRATLGDYCLDNPRVIVECSEDSDEDDAGLFDEEVHDFIKVEPGPSYLSQQNTGRPQHLIGFYSSEGIALRKRSKKVPVLPRKKQKVVINHE